MNNQKKSKIEKWMKIELTNILKVKAKNPIFYDITITDVKVTNDLSYATISWYLYCSDKNKINDISKSLDKVQGFCRKELAQISNTYSVPRLRFKYDNNIDKVNRIEEILTQIKIDKNK